MLKKKNVLFLFRKKWDVDCFLYGLVRIFKCKILYGDIFQSQRERIFVGFCDKYFNIFVVIDVVVCGFDVFNVDLVSLNYICIFFE